MKNTFIGVILAAILMFGVTGLAEAKTSVKGYFKPSTGRYVAPSYRSSPNSTKLDNWSTKGNYNPFTGKAGTKSPYRW